MKIRTGIVLHGKPSREKYFDPTLPPPSQRHWLAWVTNELREREIDVATPDVPEPYEPLYETWEATLDQFRDCVDAGLLIGHSAAGSFFLRWLSENPGLQPRQLVMVAPWLDLDHKYGDYSRFKIDRRLPERIGDIVIINSLDDSEDIHRSLEVIEEALPDARIVNLSGFGHFMLGNAMTSPEFPELVEQLAV